MPEEEKRVTIEDLEKSGREIKQQEFLAQEAAKETPKEQPKVEEPEKVEAPVVTAETPAVEAPEAVAEEPVVDAQVPADPPPVGETPEQKAERLKAENRERSRAGREREQRIKQLEESQLQTNQLLQELIKQRQQPAPVTAQQPEEFQIPVERQQFEAEVARSVAKLEAEREAQRKAQEAIQRKSYEDSYVAAIHSLKELEDDPKVYDEVVALITGPDLRFNKQHSWNGIADVAKNYKEAKKQVLSGKPKPPAVPLKNDKGVAPLGAGVTTTVTTKQERPTELSPEGLEFLRKTGMSREWAEKVLAEK